MRDNQKVEKQICEIKRRLQATTPGVWKVRYPSEDDFADDIFIKSDSGQYIAQTSYDGLSNTVRDTMAADAEFIAHAKNDIKFLMEQLEILFLK